MKDLGKGVHEGILGDMISCSTGICVRNIPSNSWVRRVAGRLHCCSSIPSRRACHRDWWRIPSCLVDGSPWWRWEIREICPRHIPCSSDFPGDAGCCEMQAERGSRFGRCPRWRCGRDEQDAACSAAVLRVVLMTFLRSFQLICIHIWSPKTKRSNTIQHLVFTECDHVGLAASC